MSRDERKKANDLFQESTPVFGKKVTFDEAYPQIEDITIEVQEFGRGIDSWNKERRYTKDHLPGEFVNCSNPACYGGGFRLGFHLHKLISGKQNELEDSALCNGNEASAKGRRVYRSCVNGFKFKISVKYKNDSSETNGES